MLPVKTKEDRAHLCNVLGRTMAHRVVRLDPLHPHVNDGARPVGIALVDRDEDGILGENVGLGVDMHVRSASTSPSLV